MEPGPDADGFVSASTREQAPGSRYLVAAYRQGVFVGWKESNVPETREVGALDDGGHLWEWIGKKPSADAEQVYRRDRLVFEIWEREVREQVP